MTCQQCQQENPPQARFCIRCGTSLMARCGKCGTELPAEARFCFSCGEAIGAVQAAPRVTGPRSYTPKHLAERILTSKAAIEGERKQVTVLFVDIADSTRLAERLDPEAMHEVLDRVLRLMADAVHRYEGTVNQYLGDGLMALFGAPLAIEDHAVRAVHAALAIQETMQGLAEQSEKERGVAIRVRIGLNTGLVVVGKIGDDLRMDYTAVGDTTHLASRMQSLAEPGTIVITDATYHLVAGFVRSESLGEMEVKGVSSPIPVHRVTGRRGRTRFEVSAERGLSALVGRSRERQALHDHLARAIGGRGQVVGLMGEPGVGKSRLLHESRQSLGPSRITWLSGQCVAYGQTTPYLPILQALRTSLQIDEGDHVYQIDEKLRRGVALLDPALSEHLPFLRELLVPGGDAQLLKMDPKEKRAKTFDALRALTVAGAQRSPLIIAIEDLHWIDHTSEDYLAFLVDSLAGLPVLLLTTYRPGYAVRWAERTYFSQMTLDVLPSQETADLVRALLGVEAVPPDLLALVQSKAEGNPLFVEELIRAVLERGLLVREHEGVRWSGTRGVDFPATAQDIIRARIDQLEEPVKRTAQTAAVIGREFGMRLLERIAETGSLLQEYVGTLKRSEFIYEKRFFPEIEFIFKHAIVQDVAYQSILLRRRRELHRAIGLAIEELYADRLAEHYELLAYHFQKAEDREKALEYLLKAGEKAQRMNAGHEAFGCFRAALDILGEEESKRRADVLHRLGMLSVFYAADADAGVSYLQNALSLYQRLDDRKGLIATHADISGLYIGGWWDGAREDRALEHLEAAAGLMEDDPDGVPKGLLYQRTAHLYLHRGETATALHWAQRAEDLFRRLNVAMGTCWGTARTYAGAIDEGTAYNEKNWEAVRKGGNPLIIAILGHELTLTWALTLNPARAREWGGRVLPEVRRTKSVVFENYILRPLSLAYAISGDVSLFDEAKAHLLQAERRTLISGCHWEDACGVGLGDVRRGHATAAIEHLEPLIADYRERNQGAAVTACSLVLGQAYAACGQHAEAERLMAESLRAARRGGNVLLELWIRPALASLFVSLGRIDEAAHTVDEGLRLLRDNTAWYGLPGLLYLADARILRARGQWDGAERRFDEVLSIARRYELQWEQAHCLLEWARMLRTRGHRSDRARIQAYLADSAARFDRIGAAALRDEVRATVSEM